MNRREFIATAASASLLAVLGACSSATGAAFSVLPDTFDFVAGIDQRIAVAIGDRAGNPITPTGAARIQIGPTDGALSAPLPTTVHTDGVPPYLLSSYRFDTVGGYTIRVTDRGGHAELAVTAIQPTSTPIPIVGRPLISVPTPTAAATLGVNPICTAQPPCPFHTVSLDEALAQHRPVALQFATPALCQSRLCGPVLQNLVAVHAPFTDVAFVHVEIYTDLSGQQSSPPVLAYHLAHEPLLLLAGSDGVVRYRLDNGYDRAEAVSVLQQLH